MSAVLLLTGYGFVRAKKVDAHRACMGLALAASTAFLASYLIYHYRVGSVRFEGQGAVRPIYFALLISHVILAAAVAPMVLRTVWLAVSGRVDDHKRWARVTLPIWLYVSLTGIIVYVMLYRISW